ncbi:spore germination lipoprotein GerD [Peribacillus alkalitolerans]|uniref:spore germination lipoprotein GerD n=1 Tax=Peribacillus alkalitolerans TaxID=1550385 RepID=UPI0013D0A4DF|nr:spore germination lipoprotein GerD [Peribacillus alkalitolerans]
MTKSTSFITITILIFILAGCNQQEAGAGKADYEETKKMVVDILKTDDGKKAIQEVMSDDKMKSQLIMDQAVVSDTIEKTVISEKGKDFWKKTFKDPKFASSYAKSMEEEHKKLLKELMKDPAYRATLNEILMDKEMQKEISKVVKSNEVREEMKKTMIETFSSPLFQAKIQGILLKAATEQAEGKEGGGKEKSGGGSDGGEGGGDQGSEGGQ